MDWSTVIRLNVIVLFLGVPAYAITSDAPSSTGPLTTPSTSHDRAASFYAIKDIVAEDETLEQRQVSDGELARVEGGAMYTISRPPSPPAGPVPIPYPNTTLSTIQR